MASVSQNKRQKMSDPQCVEDIVPINYKELDIIGTGMFLFILKICSRIEVIRSNNVQFKLNYKLALNIFELDRK